MNPFNGQQPPPTSQHYKPYTFTPDNDSVLSFLESPTTATPATTSPGQDPNWPLNHQVSPSNTSSHTSNNSVTSTLSSSSNLTSIRPIPTSQLPSTAATATAAYNEAGTVHHQQQQQPQQLQQNVSRNIHSTVSAN